MNIQENYSLKNLTTIKVGGPARFFTRVTNLGELNEAIEFSKKKKLKIFILSGGSNVVVSDRGFDGLVIQINIAGFKTVKEDNKSVVVSVGAGEIWDRVVERAVKSGWWGIENLSSIPGRMGACAAQNSGAYGQEVGEVIDKIIALRIEDGKIKIFNKDECRYGYRQSRFNTIDAYKYIIVEVLLKLSKKENFQIDYFDVRQYFKEENIKNPNLEQIRQAIIYIRGNKLPDMAKVGNAGSFFKNSVVSKEEFEVFLSKIRENFSRQIFEKAKEFREKYSGPEGIKIFTAWLIDICGLKGTQAGHVKVYEKQPLVLITEPGKATADEVMRLFQKIRFEVHQKTGLEILPEPRLVGFSKEELERYFKLS